MNELTPKFSGVDGALTVLCLKVSEAKLGALAGDQQLSVQGENHRFVLHVDHATDHVALFPRMSKVAAASVHTSTLQRKREVLRFFAEYDANKTVMIKVILL